MYPPVVSHHAPKSPVSSKAPASADPKTGRPEVRYRCQACGNLTRFDVTRTTTTSSFFHYTVGGELTEEDVEIVAETVLDVACRWCGPRGEIIEVANSAVEPVGVGDQPPDVP